MKLENGILSILINIINIFLGTNLRNSGTVSRVYPRVYYGHSVSLFLVFLLFNTIEFVYIIIEMHHIDMRKEGYRQCHWMPASWGLNKHVK